MLSISNSFVSNEISILSKSGKSFWLIPKLFTKPGHAIATTIVFFPLSTVLPFVTTMLLAFVLSNIVDVIITNGTYIVSVFPLIDTVLASLFVYSIVILTFPLFPTKSLANISSPFNSYLMLHPIGNSLSVFP